MKKSGQVKKKMYQTYIMVLCVPVLLSIFFYYYTYHEVTKDALLYNGNLNNTIRNIYDAKIQYYQGIVYQLKINDNVSMMVKESAYHTSDSYWNSYVVQKLLADMKDVMCFSGLECKDVFLYLDESDKVIYSSSVMNYEHYNDEMLHMSEEQAETFKNYIQNLKKETVFHMKVKNGENYFLVLQPTLKAPSQTEKGVIGVLINVDKIDIEEQASDWKGNMEWIIVDSQNNVIRMPEIWENVDVDLGALDITSGENVTINGTKYLLDVTISEVCDWKYVLMIPTEAIDSSVGSLRTAFLMCFVISLIAGYLIMRKSMEVTYRPLEKMVAVFKDDAEEEDNEYSYLNKQVNLLMEKNKFTQKNMHKYEKHVRGFTIEQLLTLSKIDRANPKYRQDILAKFETGTNVVLVYSVKVFGVEVASERAMEENYLRRFIVSNVIEENFEKMFAQETYIYGDEVVSIIHITEKDENYSETLQKLAEELDQRIWEKFQIKVYMLEGGKHYGLDGIHQSYMEARLSENIALELNELYVRYNEIKDRMVHKYQYSFEMQQLLINAIRSNNGEFAISIIDNILESNFEDNSIVHIEIRKYVLYDMFSTLLKASQDAGIGIDRVLEMSRVVDCDSKDSAYTYFADAIKAICNENNEMIVDSQKVVFCQKITAYIEENFTDADLNVSQIALEFQISPSYLSSIYKKHTGESILEVIRSYRIEYAKKLLENGLSIAEVSVKAGFRESASFVRAFKKITGITPGQWKEIVKK